MPDYSLYYPTIEFQDYTWLWSASLLWDRIYRIIPEGYEADDPRLCNRTGCHDGEVWVEPYLCGVSVPMVLGTLLWRPYDRAFRATLLAQQIEMIHVQSTAAFRSTTDVERRIQICREATASLQSLFNQETTDTPERKLKKTKKGKH